MPKSPIRVLASRMADVVGASPLGAGLVRRGAVVPVRFKIPVFQRILSAIAARSADAAALVETNGGIADDIRLQLPQSKHQLLFGRPTRDIAERATLALTLQLLTNSRAFLDVGANDGLYTLAVSKARTALLDQGIHAFEPDPEIFDRLSRNIARNAIDAKLNALAVGSASGVAMFHRNLSDDSSGSLTDHFTGCHVTEQISVEVIALRDYLETADIREACLKVDAEGAGAAVWDGLTGAAFDRVSWLIMEIIGPETAAQLPRRIVEESGCNAFYIRDFELVHAPRGAFTYVAPFYNWLFCRASLAEVAERTAAAGFRVVRSAQR